MRGRGPAPIPYAPRGVLVDPHGRRLRYLRLSVTDRCNYRCAYCMPAAGIPLRPRAERLTLEEVARLGRLMCEMGFDKIRLTGGEPTVRQGLVRLIASLQGTPGLRDLSMTTNGWDLLTEAAAYREAGLSRVNLSLDTLDPERYRAITRTGDLSRVLAGIEQLLRLRWTPVKLNMVVMRGFNDDEVVQMVDRFVDDPVDVRFIEYMPFGGDAERTVPWAETRARLERRYRLVDDAGREDDGPATRFRIAGSPWRIATIAPQSHRFCHRCNRIRLEADGSLRTCLARSSRDRSLRDAMRAGASDDDLEQIIRTAAGAKPRHYTTDELGRPRYEGNMSQVGG